ncbi:MAG TPA: LuxR C-terminal-related transcriptional regulator [Gammaproteobacteria bacterium]
MSQDLVALPDLLHGWRIRGIQYMDQAYLDPIRVRSAMQLKMIDDPGATNIALAGAAGQFRSYRLSAGTLVELASFRQTEHYDIYYTRPGVSDRLWVVFPVSADAESIFCFDRFGAQGAFSDEELGVVALALRGIKWFHRQLLLSHGLGICVEPLTTGERKVKQGLLSGATEKEIAQQLNFSAGTVHQYAMRVYRKFGVKGRAEFMALWLSGGS